jgi:hypothetical protein
MLTDAFLEILFKDERLQSSSGTANTINIDDLLEQSDKTDFTHMDTNRYDRTFLVALRFKSY